MSNFIKPSCDRKTRAYDNEFNTFGLMPGPDGSCPCATTGEGGCWNKPVGHRVNTCYVDRLMRCWSNLKKLLAHNTKLLMSSTQQEMFKHLTGEFDRYVDTNSDRQQHPAYRIHWSGDIFSLAYACALKDAMSFYPFIKFWCYTRSLFAIPVLCDVPNLSLYISADPCNLRQAVDCYMKYKDKANTLNIAYMSDIHDFNQRLKYILKVRTKSILDMQLAACPVDAGKLAIDGGCNKCRMCIDGKKSVWFKT